MDDTLKRRVVEALNNHHFGGKEVLHVFDERDYQIRHELLIAKYINKHVFEGAEIAFVVETNHPMILSREGYDCTFGWGTIHTTMSLYDIDLRDFLRQKLNSRIKSNAFDFWYSWRIPTYSGPKCFETTLRLSTEDFFKLVDLARYEFPS